MRYDLRSRKNRILCLPESTEDIMVLREDCINVTKQKSSEWWSIEDCLVNRVVLGLDVHMKLPVIKDKKSASVEPNERLRDFQLRDLQRMLGLRFILNTNPMGYGKTVEALAYARSIGAKRILIICPKIIRQQWKAQGDKWYPEVFQNKSSAILLSPKSFRSTQFPLVVITNYEQLLNASVAENLRSVQWDLLIVDEIHRLKSPKAKTTLALRTVPATNKVGLTGTPILRYADDLWSVCYQLDPWYLGSSYWGFVYKFCNVEDTFWGQKITGLTRNKKHIDILKKVLSYFTIWNPKNAVGVGSQESDVVLEMYPEQKKIYRQVKALAIKELQAQGITVANGMSQLVKLQQITSNPALFDVHKNIKFDWILDLLKDNPGLKVLVFSRFKTTIYALGEALEQAGIKSTAIHGDVPDTQREENKWQFNNDPEIRVMAGTLGALSESVDGLQQNCHTVVFIDKQWNPEINNQAIGRVLRMEQTQFVDVYTLVCEETVDEKVGKVNVAKLEDIRAVLDIGSN